MEKSISWKELVIIKLKFVGEFLLSSWCYNMAAALYLE